MSKTKDIREAVESELRHDPRVDAVGITVKNMNGNVARVGTVPSYPQPHADRHGAVRQPAAAARWAVGGLTGLRNVHDKIELAFSVEQADVKERVKKALERHGLYSKQRLPGPPATWFEGAERGKQQPPSVRDNSFIHPNGRWRLSCSG